LITFLLRPSLGKRIHWQVFDDDSRLLRFLRNEGEFSEAQIKLLAERENIEIVDVDDGPLPKGIVLLENLFD
jgi:hypothetical protein